MGANSWLTAPGTSQSSVGVEATSSPLDAAIQSCGVSTVKVKAALRSGCSNTANTRRQSAGSYCV